jgi:hypothetical protein
MTIPTPGTHLHRSTEDLLKNLPLHLTNRVVNLRQHRKWTRCLTQNPQATLVSRLDVETTGLHLTGQHIQTVVQTFTTSQLTPKSLRQHVTHSIQ